MIVTIKVKYLVLWYAFPQILADNQDVITMVAAVLQIFCQETNSVKRSDSVHYVETAFYPHLISGRGVY